jgi:hypothetical protein
MMLALKKLARSSDANTYLLSNLQLEHLMSRDGSYGQECAPLSPLWL